MSIKKSIKTCVEYRAVLGFPEYRIGSDGTVWSCWTRSTTKARSYFVGTKWRKRKTFVTRYGYRIANLCRDGKQYTRYIHRLILESFVGPCPKGMQCAHWDGNKLNNKLENLRWATPKKNNQDKIRHGTSKRGTEHNLVKLTEKDVLLIRRLSKEGWTNEEIQQYFPVKKACIWKIVNRVRWKHI